MQPRQNVPPLPIYGSAQPPRMDGMAPPLPNQQAMATISPAACPIGNAVSGPSKIDPNQIPRPVPSSSVLLHVTRQGNQANPPPIPCTSDLLNSSGMQLALLVQPLALPHLSEEPIQIVDFGEGGPVHCSHYKGYINSFMKFVDQGGRFICNFCGKLVQPQEHAVRLAELLLIFQRVRGQWWESLHLSNSYSVKHAINHVRGQWWESLHLSNSYSVKHAINHGARNL
ncbi:putative Zinc finger, Sec23/Sec24-type [Helianthus debilis subsp. tardiflorus]